MSIELVMPSDHLILLPSSPPARSLSQHQGLFQRVVSSNQVAKGLEFQHQHQSFQFGVDFQITWVQLEKIINLRTEAWSSLMFRYRRSGTTSKRDWRRHLSDNRKPRDPGRKFSLRRIIYSTQCYWEFKKNKDRELFDTEFSSEKDLDKSYFRCSGGRQTYLDWVQEKWDTCTWAMNIDNSVVEFCSKRKEKIG